MTRAYRDRLVAASRTYRVYYRSLFKSRYDVLLGNKEISSYADEVTAQAECDRLNGLEIVRAMREATKEMYEASFPSGEYWEDISPESVWRNMCDEAGK